jgi:hypothetical protein
LPDKCVAKFGRIFLGRAVQGPNYKFCFLTFAYEGIENRIFHEWWHWITIFVKTAMFSKGLNFFLSGRFFLPNLARKYWRELATLAGCDFREPARVKSAILRVPHTYPALLTSGPGLGSCQKLTGKKLANKVSCCTG